VYRLFPHRCHHRFWGAICNHGKRLKVDHSLFGQFRRSETRGSRGLMRAGVPRVQLPFMKHRNGVWVWTTVDDVPLDTVNGYGTDV
jgi:hypothetical protein